MNKILQRRLKNLSPKKPTHLRVIIVPPNRSDEINQIDAKELLRAGGYPANPNPWIIIDNDTKEAHVLVIDDFEKLMEAARNGKRIGDR